MNDVLGFQLERYVPSVIAGAGEHRLSSGESAMVTLKARRPVVSLREICTGTAAQLCTGVTQAAGDAADTVSVCACARVARARKAKGRAVNQRRRHKMVRESITGLMKTCVRCGARRPLDG